MPALTTLDCAHFPHDRVAALGVRAPQLTALCIHGDEDVKAVVNGTLAHDILRSLPKLRSLTLPCATIMLHDLAPFDTQLETLDVRWIGTVENPERHRLVSHRGMLAIRMLKLTHVRAGMSAEDAPLVLACMPALARHDASRDASRDAIFVGGTPAGEPVDPRQVGIPEAWSFTRH